MDWLTAISPAVLAISIPIIFAIGWIISMILKHRERMALIERGMDPLLLERNTEKRTKVEQRR